MPRVKIKNTLRSLGFCLLTSALGVEGLRAECVTAPAQLVAWWRAESNATDFVGTNHGTMHNGATFTTNGFVGTSFSLDGVDDYVDIGDLAVLDGASEITVVAWVKRLNTDNTVAGIVGKWNDVSSTNNTFLLYDGEAGFMNRGGFVVAFNDGSYAFVFGSTVMARDQWYQVAATWRSSDGRLAFYKNGALENALSGGMGRVLKSHRAYTAKIGEWGVLHNSLYRFPGLIDEVMIFNRALAGDEITAIYNAGSAGLCVSPRLSIARTPTNTALVFWPSPSAGFELQQNTNGISLVNWSNVTVVNDNGTNKFITVNPPTGNRFYRLIKP
jgi:hypothetical protein